MANYNSYNYWNVNFADIYLQKTSAASTRSQATAGETEVLVKPYWCKKWSNI